MTNTKIIWINTLLFFLGWTFIMLLGSDFPPPSGFFWMVLLILALDLIQYQYLRYFLPKLRIREKRSLRFFIKNLLFFALGAMLVSIGFMMTDSNTSFGQVLPWIVIITVVGAIYGATFWFFNLLLTRSVQD